MLKMKSVYKVLLVATMLFNISIASAAYVVTNSNTAFTPGFVTGSIPSFTLEGSDGLFGSTPNTVTYTDTFLSNTTLSFDWQYQSKDTRGTFDDKAGYVLNNTFTQLSTNIINRGIQSGSVLISITANDIFGWYINSSDSQFGNATLTVTNYSSTAPVPELDTSAMLLMGAGVMGFIARRRKQVVASRNY
jgi:hypothetical protein